MSEIRNSLFCSNCLKTINAPSIFTTGQLLCSECKELRVKTSDRTDAWQSESVETQCHDCGTTIYVPKDTTITQRHHARCHSCDAKRLAEYMSLVSKANSAKGDKTTGGDYERGFDAALKIVVQEINDIIARYTDTIAIREIRACLNNHINDSNKRIKFRSKGQETL